MLDILNTIFQFILTGITFIINTLTSLLSLLLKIPSYVAFLSTNIMTLPSLLIPFLLASISIYVIMLVLGRNS